MSGVSQEVLGGLILAAIIWIGGLLFQLLHSRSSEMASLRRYERLRAKVEVLSRLTSIELTGHENTELCQRQHLLVRSELHSVLDELEKEEQTTSSHPMRFRDLLKPLEIGPSFGVWAIVTKGLLYASSFLFLCVVSISLLFWITPAPASPVESTDDQALLVGMICILSFFGLLVVFSYGLARLAHRGNLLTAELAHKTPECCNNPQP